MKKNILKVFACAVAVTMSLSLFACGKDDEDTKSKTEQSSTEKSEDETSEESTEKFASIDEYINDETIKAQLDAMIESMEGSGMTMEIKADGNKLVYTYKYTELVKSEGMEETLKAGLDEQASNFTDAASAIKDAVEVENPVIVIEYVDANGEMIVSQEFAAE